MFFSEHVIQTMEDFSTDGTERSEDTTETSIRSSSFVLPSSPLEFLSDHETGSPPSIYHSNDNTSSADSAYHEVEAVQETEADRSPGSDHDQVPDYL